MRNSGIERFYYIFSDFEIERFHYKGLIGIRGGNQKAFWQEEKDTELKTSK